MQIRADTENPSGSSGGHWDDKDMIEVMLDVARTSLKMLGKDLFSQITKR